MADEGSAERLVVLLEARIRDFEKNMQKASGTADRTYRQMRQQSRSATRQMEQDIIRSTSRINQALAATSTKIGAYGKAMAGAFAAGISLRAAQTLIDSATRIQNALKVAGLSGEELTNVYDRLFQSAQKNAVPLEALTTLYGRAAQQQKELGVSTEQLLKFTDDVALALRVAGTDANAASGALLQLGQALGSGTVHAEEFNSILEGAPTIAQAAAAGIKEANGSVAALKQLVVDGKLSSRAFFDGFAAGADTLAERAAGAETTISGRFVRLQNILTDTAGKFDKNSHAAEMFGRFLDDLAVAIRQFADNMAAAAPAIGQVEDFLNMVNAAAERLGKSIGSMTGLDQVAPAINNALNGVDIDPVQKKLGELQKTVNALQDAIKFNTEMGIDTTTVQAQLDQVLAKMAAIRSGAIPVVAPMSDQSDKAVNDAINGMVPFNPLDPVNSATKKAAQITLADYPVTGGNKKKGGTKAVKKTADDAFAENIQAVRDRIAAMKEEQATLGMSFEAQQRRKISLDLEQQALKDVQEAARRKGDADWRNVQLSQQQKDAIDKVSQAYAEQAEQLRQAQEAQELRSDMVRAGLDGVRNALEDGKITLKEWGDIGISVLDRFIDKIEDDLVNAIMQANSAGGGGSILGNLFSFLGGGSSSGGGIPWSEDIFRASGGPVKAGQPYIVGEKRPELFVPDRSGTILPKVPDLVMPPTVTAPAGGDQHVSVSYAPQITVQGGDESTVDDLKREMRKTFDTEFLPRTVKAIREAKTRGLL